MKSGKRKYFYNKNLNNIAYYENESRYDKIRYCWLRMNKTSLMHGLQRYVARPELHHPYCCRWRGRSAYVFDLRPDVCRYKCYYVFSTGFEMVRHIRQTDKRTPVLVVFPSILRLVELRTRGQRLSEKAFPPGTYRNKRGGKAFTFSRFPPSLVALPPYQQ